MSGAECIALALEKESNDLVRAVSGGWGLERDEGFIVLVS
jgi:hypothetical protein